MGEPLETFPPPDDPVLAEWSATLDDAGNLAVVLDTSWRIVFATDELRRIWEAAGHGIPSAGWHYYGPEMRRMRRARDGSPDGGRGVPTDHPCHQ